MCTVFAGALCHTTEKKVAILTSEGRILLWEVEFEQVQCTYVCCVCTPECMCVWYMFSRREGERPICAITHI